MYRWLHFCKYDRHRYPLYLCTITSSVYRHLEINWMDACICWRITKQWNAFWTKKKKKKKKTRQTVLDKRFYFINVNSRLHPVVFSVLMFENLRFSTKSIFLVFAFPGMCDKHFQEDAIIYFSETSAAVSQPFRFWTCHCISLGIGSHFRIYVNTHEEK